jgi:predicted dithiol-disulfide oxidoreductase (DUF899 family)
MAVVPCGQPGDSNDLVRLLQADHGPTRMPDESSDALIAGRHFGMKVCYLRDGDRVFETYWTTGRECEVMGNSYGMLDMTVHGRQDRWED